MEKILISACLLGNPVRFDGGAKTQDHPKLSLWKEEGRFILQCPEIAGGLSVPRPAAEIQQHHEALRIETNTGIDVTQEFLLGAKKSLELCLQHNIKIAILKESSPSCGSTTVHDGNFIGNKIPGEGVTTKLLREHGIQVFSENTIDEAATAITMLESQAE